MFVNLHGANKLIGTAKGYNRKAKHRAYYDPHGFKHHTMPLKWSLFGVQEVQERYSKSGTYHYVHFDNSFKTFKYPNSSVKFSNYFYHAVEKKDSSKWSNTDCQYTEVDSFETFQKMLYERFVNGMTGQKLDDALELNSPKNPPHRPLGSKNKSKSIKRIDIRSMLT